jgi:hypothetical protein
MHIKGVYISCYKYDIDFAKICIASIRHWYPEIPIYLIKDTGQGEFNTKPLEHAWQVKVLPTTRKRFGWGFGKWEPLFIEGDGSFLVLDADTVLAGPVIDIAEKTDADFLVDEEEQPYDRLNEIYYKVERLGEVDERFVYPGYTFNEGQWFGTHGLLKRSDFDAILDWSEEPQKPKFPEIILQGAQGHLNFTLQLKEQLGEIGIARKRIMVWPENGNADFISLSSISRKDGEYPFIIHWAGFGFSNYADLPRHDIIRFYRDVYYSRFDTITRYQDEAMRRYRVTEKSFKKKLRGLKAAIKSRI